MPPPIYGASIVGQEIHDSKIINQTFNTCYLNIILTRNLIHPEGVLSRLLSYLIIYLKLICILISHRFDLCYLAITCHGVAFLKDSLFVLTCKLFCKRIIIHQHNKGMSLDADRKIYKTLYRWVYKNTKVILLSQYLYNDISKHVSKDQTCVCHNGSPEFSLPPTRIYTKATPSRIVFLSNLFFDKGIITFLDCCDILNKNGVRFYADIVGAETSELNTYDLKREIQARSLTDIIIYHGKKTGDERNIILSKGTYFLFPTKNEAFPLVLLEAKQFHMICLSTPIGGIKDIIQDGINGFLCSPDDPDSFAQRIMQLEKDTPKKEMISQNAFIDYKNRFTITHFEKNMIKCLNTALGETDNAK